MKNIKYHNIGGVPDLHFLNTLKGPLWTWSYGNCIYNYLCNQCLSPEMLWVRISIRTRCTTFCDHVCQWLATGRWVSLGPPVSSINKADRQDIIEMLLKMALSTIKHIKQTINKLITIETKVFFLIWRHYDIIAPKDS